MCLLLAHASFLAVRAVPLPATVTGLALGAALLSFWVYAQASDRVFTRAAGVLLLRTADLEVIASPRAA